MQFASSPAFEPVHRCERESFAEYKMYQSVMGCKFVSYFDKKKTQHTDWQSLRKLNIKYTL